MRVIYPIAGGETDGDGEPTTDAGAEAAPDDAGAGSANQEPGEAAQDAAGDAGGTDGDGATSDGAGTDTGEADTGEDEPGWLKGIHDRLDRMEQRMTSQPARRQQAAPRRSQTQVTVKEEPPKERPQERTRKAKRPKWGKRSTT